MEKLLLDHMKENHPEWLPFERIELYEAKGAVTPLTYSVLKGEKYENKNNIRIIQPKTVCRIL